MSFITPSQQPWERRRGDVERATDMTGRVYRCLGFIDAIGAGQAMIEVSFPIYFIEPPSFSFGGEMQPGQVLEAGSFPTISMVVVEWRYRAPVGTTLATFYIGALVAVTTTGLNDQRMIGHWQMEGKALRNPIGGSSNVNTDSTI